MQQASLAERPPTFSTGSGDPAATAPSNAFVINLISSTSPVTLTRPDHAGLKRFTFFVSRRREEGRERFRLHMGYFETQEEAERLLDIVRGIYPGAWAGAAPGRRLAAAAASSAAAPPKVEPVAPAPLERLTKVAPAPSANQDAAGAAEASTRPAVAAQPPAVPGPPSSPPARAAELVALALVPDAGRRLPLEAQRASEQRGAASSLNNIRAAIASLDEHAATAPVLQALPELKPAAVIPTVQPVPPKAPTRAATALNAAEAAELSDTGALHVLESGAKKSAPSARRSVPPSAAARLPTPQPLRSHSAPEGAAAAQPRDEKPCYAVQLMWSVQPIAMTQVPQLAIFSAYTLYGAEGNRDGRRWYGLRLGFFTDAVSAKQVAHYVRADFSTVSVVPVTVREREHAMLAVSRAAGPITPSATTKAQPKNPEFAFIDGTEPVTVKGAKPEGAVPKRQNAAVRATRGAPGKRAKVRPAGRINANARTKPMTLEETLEILGASQLQIDDAPGASINDSGVRHLRLEQAKVKPSKLTRLFERLSERLGN